MVMEPLVIFFGPCIALNLGITMLYRSLVRALHPTTGQYARTMSVAALEFHVAAVRAAAMCQRLAMDTHATTLMAALVPHFMWQRCELQ
jgi:hypothetical protein